MDKKSSNEKNASGNNTPEQNAVLLSNKKMEKDIEALKTKLNEVTSEHESIKRVLESEQNAWVKPKVKHVSAPAPVEIINNEIPTCSNRFAVIDVDANSQSSHDEVGNSQPGEGTNLSDDSENQSLFEAAAVSTSKPNDLKTQVNEYRSLHKSKFKNRIENPKDKSNVNL